MQIISFTDVVLLSINHHLYCIDIGNQFRYCAVGIDFH